MSIVITARVAVRYLPWVLCTGVWAQAPAAKKPPVQMVGLPAQSAVPPAVGCAMLAALDLTNVAEGLRRE